MEKTRKFIMMVGVPGAGKNWAIDNLINSEAHVVSRDAIRYTLVDETSPYFEKEKEVFNTFVQEIKESLAENEVTIANATHISTYSRAKLLNALGDSLKGVTVTAVVINTPLEKCLEQNDRREGRAVVPHRVIETMFEDFKFPTFDEPFDYITTITNGRYTNIVARENSEV